MVTATLEEAFHTAVSKALDALGDDVKGMSCFLHNWKNVNVTPAADEDLEFESAA